MRRKATRARSRHYGVVTRGLGESIGEPVLGRIAWNKKKLAWVHVYLFEPLRIYPFWDRRSDKSQLQRLFQAEQEISRCQLDTPDAALRYFCKCPPEGVNRDWWQKWSKDDVFEYFCKCHDAVYRLALRRCDQLNVLTDEHIAFINDDLTAARSCWFDRTPAPEGRSHATASRKIKLSGNEITIAVGVSDEGEEPELTEYPTLVDCYTPSNSFLSLLFLHKPFPRLSGLAVLLLELAGPSHQIDLSRCPVCKRMFPYISGGETFSVRGKGGKEPMGTRLCCPNDSRAEIKGIIEEERWPALIVPPETRCRAKVSRKILGKVFNQMIDVRAAEHRIVQQDLENYEKKCAEWFGSRRKVK